MPSCRPPKGEAIKIALIFCHAQASIETSEILGRYWHLASFRCDAKFVRFRTIVLQNYFYDQNEQHWFKDERKHAILIQCAIQVDSIIALSQCSEEFCNTIGGKADTERTGWRRVSGKSNRFIAVLLALTSDLTRREQIHPRSRRGRHWRWTEQTDRRAFLPIRARVGTYRPALCADHARIQL
jgi:hypothetical protein